MALRGPAKRQGVSFARWCSSAPDAALMRPHLDRQCIASVGTESYAEDKLPSARPSAAV
jgi:hypothetical protein